MLNGKQAAYASGVTLILYYNGSVYIETALPGGSCGVVPVGPDLCGSARLERRYRRVRIIEWAKL